MCEKYEHIMTKMIIIDIEVITNVTEIMHINVSIINFNIRI